ncbi:hypothetical protein K461DRAFT_11702 [Myriangium duriaei CBS 260.36]|uniref:Uncharacterized protein n=1 Tax=Myriangium duriaei CBS 260.36 TaxID=1168546 RepID=A0A9P4J900_9PEZI|nr:hypothetical protein K461DRAFT_11702 [Myriangium duriaei CBS 260.36]
MAGSESGKRIKSTAPMARYQHQFRCQFPMRKPHKSRAEFRSISASVTLLVFTTPPHRATSFTCRHVHGHRIHGTPAQTTRETRTPAASRPPQMRNELADSGSPNCAACHTHNLVCSVQSMRVV